MKILLPNNREIQVQRAVVKLGTKQITDLNSINYDNIRNLVRQIVDLKKQGVEFILTVSGAIGLGIFELFGNGKNSDELTLSQKQAIAGLGQIRLMEIFKEEFGKYNIRVGQVLLTHFIFENRSAFLNARNTLNSMLEMGIIPIINENDSVAVEEIKVGQNDSLGAYVSLLSDADLYVMLTDIDGLYKNYQSENRELIPLVENISQVVRFAGKQEEKFSTGGMLTKLQAAKVTTISGVACVIANGFKENILNKIFDRLSEGTIFLPAEKNLIHKKRWITVRKTRGQIVVDEGAANAVRKHKSLLPSGIIRTEGVFKHGDTVLIADPLGMEIAVGLTNYSSDEISQITGKKMREIEAILGRDSRYSCVIHIDNMVLMD